MPENGEQVHDGRRLEETLRKAVTTQAATLESADHPANTAAGVLYLTEAARHAHDLGWFEAPEPADQDEDLHGRRLAAAHEAMLVELRDTFAAAETDTAQRLAARIEVHLGAPAEALERARERADGGQP